MPQRPRGERRVAEVIAAAESVIAEVGYEAATMTAIAERAGASIGAVYQYFPNKEALVRALRTLYGGELDALLAPLSEEATRSSIEQIVERIFEIQLQYMAARPAYAPLLSAPSHFRRDATARVRLREHFAGIYRKKKPSLSPEEAFRIANVSFQILGGMHRLLAESPAKERDAVATEFKTALRAYLVARLGAR